MFKKRDTQETRVEELPRTGALNVKTIDGGYLGPGAEDDPFSYRSKRDKRRRSSTLSNMNAGTDAWGDDGASSVTSADDNVKREKCCNPDYGICGGCCYPFSCLGFSNNQGLILMAIGLLTILAGLIVGFVLLMTSVLNNRRICYTPECVVAAGEMITAMDRSVDPCDDFYEFACGGWKRHNPVPAGSMGWDSFSINAATTYFSIKELLEAESTVEEPEFVTKTKNFYRACANETAWEITGVEPLLYELGKAGGFPLINSSWSPDSFDWLDSVILTRVLYAADYILSIGVSYDSKNSSNNVIHLGEGYLPSPREYILSNETRYRNMELQRIFSLANTLGNAMPGTAGLNQSSVEPVLLNVSDINSNNSTTITTSAPVQTELPLSTEPVTTTSPNSRKMNPREMQDEEDEVLKLFLETSKHNKKMQVERSGAIITLDGIATDISRVKLPPVARDEEQSASAATQARAQEMQSDNITALYDFIYKLAKLTKGGADLNDLYAQYNPMTIEELQRKTDAMGNSAAKVNWLSLFNKIFGVANITVTAKERIIVTNPDYIYGVLKLIKVTPKHVIANFLSYMLALNLGEESDAGFQGAIHSSFPVSQRNSRTRHIGRQEIRPWYDCASKANSLITEAVSYLYLKQYFLPATREKAAEMMSDVHDAFRSLLKDNTWMDDETKKDGLRKVDDMVQLVGSGKNTTNVTALIELYKDLPDFGDNHFENILMIARYLSVGSLAYLRDSPSREAFGMSPVAINAAYSFGQNAMIIPAGILQPPFYRRNTFTALNYGAIGVVIGHEVSHGFDNSGKEVDAQGNLRPWWSESSLKTYSAKAKCFSDQYSQYPLETDLQGEEIALMGYKVDGNATLGENIADNGGIQAAYKAYQRRVALTREYYKLPGLEEYSNEQLFFISFGQMWCTSFTLQGLKGAILVGPHAPGPMRVKGTFHNTQQMRDAFNCPSKSENENQQTCRVW
ncbi:endothelin-converting enzyme 1 [Hyalella azteca]|uniref:Endothelin-converting enzyme 1 n=1 Tax=Hyalella azteca TaxID=294128 RepID=A0A8B7NXH8_HYAAZ|nr:endothelin-converting enzyme 1 [Hyalella azteca]